MNGHEFRANATWLGVIAITVAGVLWGVRSGGSAGRAAAQTEEQAPSDELIERGRYLVHDVAKCVVCHSPRDRQGRLEPRRLLHGGTIPFPSPYPNQTWAARAPRLAGRPAWSNTQLVTLLTTGRRPDGGRLRPPMPTYRLSLEDARAVSAYLNSLE